MGGGVVLNSKSEFNRCKLGRLTLGEGERKIISTTKKNQAAKDTGEEEYKESNTGVWERKKTQQRRLEEVRNVVDLERGLPRSPQRKRESQEGECQEERKEAAI